jgi:hypothetical protein
LYVATTQCTQSYDKLTSARSEFLFGIQVLWNATPCRWVNGSRRFLGATFLQNFGQTLNS